MTELWSWEETEKRAYESGVLCNQQLLGWFEGYLRFSKDDHFMREWVQDLIREAEFRKRAGDNFPYHPSTIDGIDSGEICLGTEVCNSTPYRIQLNRGPLHSGTPVVNLLVAGPSGAGKTNIIVGLADQVAKHGHRVLAIARNDTFRKKLPPKDRDLFSVLLLEQLRFCPSEPEHISPDAPREVVECESRKTMGRWLEVFGRRFERKDSIKLLEDIASLVFDDLNTFTTPSHDRQYPCFSDINTLVQSVAYRKRLHGKSHLEESAQLTCKTFERWGHGLFDSRHGLPWLSMIAQRNIIIETAAFKEEDALMAIEFLLGSIWQAKVFEKSYTQELELVIVVDDFQGALDPGSVIERSIRETRHQGQAFILAPQNIGRVSNDVLGNCGLFIIAGSMNGRQDLEQARAVMGVGYNDDLYKELLNRERGTVLARQPMSAYKGVVAVRTPHFQESEYPEQERRARVERWKACKEWTPPVQKAQPTPPQPVTSPKPDEVDHLKFFVIDANDNWSAPMEAHFAKASVRDGSLKKSFADHAVAMGLITLPHEGRVMGLNGKRIQLTQVSVLARKKYDLKEPDSYRQCRGSLSTRYYQYTLSRLLEDRLGMKTEIEGKVGKDLKRVDLVSRLQDGRVIAIEFASITNAQYEIHNVRVLKDQPELFAKYIIITETLQHQKLVENQLYQAGFILESKLLVVSFYEFVKDPSVYMTPSEQVNK